VEGSGWVRFFNERSGQVESDLVDSKSFELGVQIKMVISIQKSIKKWLYFLP
jgi:hypothetical protein